MTRLKMSYSMQDAISLLLLAPRPVGPGAGCIHRRTAANLLDKGYVRVRPSGDLEITPLGKAEYDAALTRRKPRDDG